MDALSARLLLRFAGDPITFAIKLVDVLADDINGTLDVLGSITATASAVNIASDRHAGTLIIGVAIGALLKGRIENEGTHRRYTSRTSPATGINGLIMINPDNSNASLITAANTNCSVKIICCVCSNSPTSCIPGAQPARPTNTPSGISSGTLSNMHGHAWMCRHRRPSRLGRAYLIR